MSVCKYDTIIIGAGAAGLMCAALTGQRSKSVLLLDHSKKLAEKIRISGGGRCNFTNINATPENYLSSSPKFCISALSRYTPRHFTELLDKYQIGYHEKTLGQLFCNNNAQDIINLLDFLNTEANVKRSQGVIVESIDKTMFGFRLNTSIGVFDCETLVIATGGLAVPQIGATGFGYEVAKQFGIGLIKPEPALVPLALSANELHYLAPLSGTSFFSNVSINKTSFQENTLITHRGLSGPAILQISSYWNGNDQVIIDLLPQCNIIEEINNNKSSNKTLENFLSAYFSVRLAKSISEMTQINKQVCQLSKIELTKLSDFIHGFALKPSGTLGFKKAEVTKGGVDCKELSSKSMMANKIDGLFFIGEVVDVTGWLGGYNFQWAWSSAFIAAHSV